MRTAKGHNLSQSKLKDGEKRQKKSLAIFHIEKKAAERTLQIYEALQHKTGHEDARVVDLLEKITHK